MSKPPLFFIVIIGLIIVAASFRFMQQRREKVAGQVAYRLYQREAQGESDVD
jgi:hypothetical protein